LKADDTEKGEAKGGGPQAKRGDGPDGRPSVVMAEPLPLLRQKERAFFPSFGDEER